MLTPNVVTYLSSTVYEEDHFGLQSFSLGELLIATENFSKINVLGRRRDSTMYKGRLADGSVVAVRRLHEHERAIEIELVIANLIAHRNVIQLCGFCITRKEQLLVYPFMVNGSVASCLRVTPEITKGQLQLDWPMRKMIALWVARGLAYLHHECIRGIIHRDVKAANILLDDDFEAFVADFTLAQFVDCDDGVLRGTAGHISPEYLSTGKCLEKTDVFGYGNFLLELITGKRAFDLARLANDDDLMLLDWVKNYYYYARGMEEMVDPNLEGSFVNVEVNMLLRIALIAHKMIQMNDP